ncbi:hypothetical protein RRG08_041299 [Elysia crispata]|uniref:Uncharacterized protein n=1 Tax=Elysia crispata TaxID=231223 RepID=A0AAE1DLV6_9GAST|nr:hypothetical protein RRG08_041299 [Elysia crispata]
MNFTSLEGILEDLGVTNHSQIVVIPQKERSVRRFTGQTGHQDLERFREDLEATWAQRSSQADPERAAFLWSNLGSEDRDEFACQGVDRGDKDALLEALSETYGDRRSLNSLSLACFSARQEGHEEAPPNGQSDGSGANSGQQQHVPGTRASTPCATSTGSVRQPGHSVPSAEPLRPMTSVEGVRRG